MPHLAGKKIEDHDTFGKAVGIMTASLAVLLSVFTISGHRAHTATIVLQNEANNLWFHFQAKRIRDYQLESFADLLQILSKTHPNAAQVRNTYDNKHTDYEKDLTEIQHEAEMKAKESVHSEKRALFFDLGEGVIEIALVLNSLYFIARKLLFPALGLAFASAGIIIGCIGFMM